MDFVNNMVVGIGNVLSHIFLIMFTVMFMLIEASGILVWAGLALVGLDFAPLWDFWPCCNWSRPWFWQL